MKSYNIKVNGVSYMVEVEEIGSCNCSNYDEIRQQKAIQESCMQKVPIKQEEVKEEKHEVTAPMPGTILEIKAQPGDSVEQGQVLMVLEAMKMENEIVAPASGTLTKMAVTQGQAVHVGEVLAEIG